MAKYYMEEVFSLKDGGYDFAPFEYEDDPFEYEDDEEVKKVFSDYEYIETTDVWHSDLQKKEVTFVDIIDEPTEFSSLLVQSAVNEINNKQKHVRVWTSQFMY